MMSEMDDLRDKLMEQESYILTLQQQLMAAESKIKQLVSNVDTLCQENVALHDEKLHRERHNRQAKRLIENPPPGFLRDLMKKAIMVGLIEEGKDQLIPYAFAKAMADQYLARHEVHDAPNVNN